MKLSINEIWTNACCFCYNLKYRHNTTSTVYSFCKQPQQPDFHFKISGFLAAIKLMDKYRYVDNGYPDMQTLASLHYVIGVPRMKESDHSNIWYSIIYRQHCSILSHYKCDFEGF